MNRINDSGSLVDLKHALLHRLPQFLAACACSNFKCCSHTIEQCIVVKRFSQGLDRSCSESLQSQLFVTLGGNKDDWNPLMGFVELAWSSRPDIPGIRDR